MVQKRFAIFFVATRWVGFQFLLICSLFPEFCTMETRTAKIKIRLIGQMNEIKLIKRHGESRASKIANSCPLTAISSIGI